jgi:gamma-glutamyltranspeptidase/glutathione hydrolase
MRFFLILFVLCFSTFAFAEIQPEPSSDYTEKEIVKSKNFMVVAANELATKAGRDIINQGGNAIDATIAIQLVLNVVEPQSSGIGGGGFLLYYDAKTKNVSSYDGRETAPKNIDPKLFLKNDNTEVDFYDAVQGGKSVGVPGLVAMLKMSHEKHGKMAWEKLFEEAIKISENGFPMSQRLYQVAQSVSYMNKFDKTSSMFLDKNGNVKAIGTTLYNKDLANIFKVLAKDKGKSFYNGNIAKNIVDTVTKTPINAGYLSLEDMKNYKAVQREVVCTTYRIYKVCGMAPPSSGGLAIGQALGILQNYDLSKNNFNYLHLILEASKLAFADRNMFLADSDFINVPIKQMLEKDYLASRAKLIDRTKSNGIYKAGELSQNNAPTPVKNEPPSTTHISIVDKEGNAVSMTTSIENAFGSVLMVDGFLLNNQLTDFSFRSEMDGKKIANRIEGGKRPRSSMSPTIILDKEDKLFMVIGSPGGSNIIPYVLKTIVAVIDWDMNIQEAINIPNFVNKNSDNTYLEKDIFSPDISKYLAKIGHKIENTELSSGLHGIVVKDGFIYGGADPHREGVAIGE